ncbi:MAG: response regulator transcription factor [Chitinophagaceae bacterium]|nr:response regulator transcription factor [Bacteroidota bacterium]TAJ60588.1 MAG: response regulator transcription factor [Chitinophagaceae bacterium]
MIKAVIIEDEKTALDNLIHHIQLTSEPVTVIATLETVEESVAWFLANPAPDLIFMDIHLKDGISFSIFDRVKISSPIIFITAFDNFMVKAFEQTSIEYLLKPINKQELAKAIAKYRTLKTHFLNNHENLLRFLSEKDTSRKSRIVVKKGIEFQSILLDEVAYFYTEQKISFLVTRDGKKFLVDKNLKELEEELDPKKFYRANRKFIINIDFVKSYRSYDKIKILVELTVPLSEEIIVSQESAIDFRKWITAL